MKPQKNNMTWQNIPHPSLSRQLAIGLGISVLPVLTVVFIVISIFGYRYYVDQLNTRANELIDDVAEILKNPLWDMNIETVQSIGDVAFRYPFLDVINIDLIQKNKTSNIYRQNKENNRSDFFLDRVILFKNIEIGQIHMGISIRLIQDQFFSFLIVFGVMLLIILMSISLSTHYFIKKYLRSPLDQLNTILHTYAAGNYCMPHEVFPNREFQRIGSVLYHMGEMTRKNIEALNHADRLLKNLNEMVFRMRVPEGCCDYVNPAVEAVMGYPMETVITTPHFLEKIIHPNYKEKYEVVWSDIVNNKGVTATYVYQIVDPAGRARWIHQSNIVFRNDVGVIVALEGCCTDITKQKEAQLEREKLQAQLRQSQKMEAIGALAGGIAHDFNNILGIIMGNLTLAINRTDTGHPVQKKLEAIHTACHRGKNIVTQILNFSHKKEFTPIPLNIGAILFESLDLIKATTPENIFIQYHPQDQLPLIKGDATQLHQVVINITTNAIHAMEDCGGTLCIKSFKTTWFNASLPGGCKADDFVSIYTPHAPEHLSESGYVQISFLDMGSGIDPAIREKILDPYFTTKRSGKGTGLGLSVVHGIVKKLDGYLSIQSAINKGTCVSILFPAMNSKEEDVSPFSHSDLSKNEDEDNVERVEDSKEIEILLVDDEESMLEMTDEVLNQFGHNVTSYINALDALDAFRCNPFKYHLLITDLNMPELSGKDLITEVLSIRADLPVILCSGGQILSDFEVFSGKGKMKFLKKPYDINELSLLIHEMVTL